MDAPGDTLVRLKTLWGAHYINSHTVGLMQRGGENGAAHLDALFLLHGDVQFSPVVRAASREMSWQQLA